MESSTESACRLREKLKFMVVGSVVLGRRRVCEGEAAKGILVWGPTSFSGCWGGDAAL